MKTIWERIEASRQRWNVLEHPFYQRWSAGELTRGELAVYAGQYRHAVTELADAAANAARAAEPELRAQLELHAGEEASHVDLWDDFAAAMGGAADAPAARAKSSHSETCSASSAACSSICARTAGSAARAVAAVASASAATACRYSPA